MRTESNLKKLIQTMQPELQDGFFVFHTSKSDFSDLLQYDPIQIFKEKEGTGVILKKETADKHNLEYSFVSSMITLNVYSSLDAVGFLAAVTEQLAKAGISVNPVSAYWHDHLFVPSDRAEEAMMILRNMMAS